jgi:methylglyoxal synthase
VKALLRLAVVWNIPAACNRATADYMISSPLMSSDYERQVPTFEGYLSRLIPVIPAIPEPTAPAAKEPSVEAKPK